MEEQNTNASSVKQDLKNGFRDTVRDIRRFAGTRILMKVIVLIGTLIAFMLVFGLGVAVGFHKASFGRAWGEHYNENFGMGRGGKMMGISIKGDLMGGFPNAHGAAGKIININLPTIIVKDKDNTEKVISLSADTVIERGRDALKNTDLKLDDFVIVIGAPNDQGQIEAKLIREIPLPEFIK
jgi:hypothetical protein